MPNEFLRNLNTGLGLANQVHQFSSNQMKVDEQRRQAQEQKQYRGALSSLQSGRDIDKDIPANVRMQAEVDHLNFQVQKAEANANLKLQGHHEQATSIYEAFFEEGGEGERVNSISDFKNLVQLDGEGSIHAKDIAASMISKRINNQEILHNDFKKYRFLKATDELNQIKKGVHEAERLVANERYEEAVTIVENVVNNSNSPYFIEHIGEGKYNISFKDLSDEGDRVPLAEGLSLKEVSEALGSFTNEGSYAIKEHRQNQIDEHNHNKAENPTVLYSNLGESFILVNKMNEKGDVNVFIEMPEGGPFTNNAGQPIVFSSEEEARQGLKQFLSEEDENFRMLDTDARTAIAYKEGKEDKGRTMSATDSARVHSAIVDAFGGTDISLNDIQARELSSQVAALMSEGKELNEAIVQVVKQYVESDSELKERTKGFNWAKWVGPGQAFQAVNVGKFIASLVKDLFGGDGARVKVDFSEEDIPPESPSKGLTPTAREEEKKPVDPRRWEAYH